MGGEEDGGVGGRGMASSTPCHPDLSLLSLPSLQDTSVAMVVALLGPHSGHHGVLPNQEAEGGDVGCKPPTQPPAKVRAPLTCTPHRACTGGAH